MSKQIIDVHIHFGAPQGKESGCYWSKEFESGVAFFAFELVTIGLFTKMDIKKIKKYLFKVINSSKHVDRCVLLAWTRSMTKMVRSTIKMDVKRGLTFMYPTPMLLI